MAAQDSFAALTAGARFDRARFHDDMERYERGPAPQPEGARVYTGPSLDFFGVGEAFGAGGGAGAGAGSSSSSSSSAPTRKRGNSLSPSGV